MGALLTLTEAARKLRMRDSAAVRWLDQRGLIHDIDGRPRVIEADVLAALRAETPRSLPARRPLARATLSTGPQDRELAGARPRAIKYGDVTAHVMKRDGQLRREDGRYYWRARATRGGVQIAVTITIAATGSAWGTRAEADAAVHEAVTRERLVEAGHAPPPDDELTVAELLDSWIAALADIGRIARSTLRTYQSSVNALKRYIGNHRVVDVSRRTLDRYIAQRFKDKVKAGGIRSDAKIWGAAIRWAIDGEHITLERAPAFPPVHYEPERGSEAPPLGVLRQMLQHLESHPEESFFEFAADVLQFMLLSGARIAEAWALAWADVDDGWVTLRGKTGERRIPASARAMQIITAQPRNRPRVLSDVSLSTFKRRIYEVLKALPWSDWGSRELRSHDMRAFFVHRCYQQNLPVHVSSHMAGHSPGVALKFYVSAQPSELTASMQRLGIDELLTVQVVDLASRRKGQERD